MHGGGALADPITCERGIAKSSAQYVAGRAKALQRCEDAKTRGTLRTSTRCTDDPQTAAKLSTLATQLFAGINRACGGADRDCGDGDDEPLASVGWGGGMRCPDLEDAGCSTPIATCSDIAACLACVDAAAVDRAMALYYGALDSHAFRTADRVNVCQQAIGRASAKYLTARARALAKCWDARLRGAHQNACPDPGDGKAAAAIASAERQQVARICRACGGAGGCDGPGALAPSDVGFVAQCPAVAPFAGPACGRAVASAQDLVDCVDCVTSFESDCADVVAGSPFSLGTPFPFELVRFDCTTGTTLRRAAFTCAITDESDTLGGAVAPSQRPACVVTLAPGP